MKSGFTYRDAFQILKILQQSMLHSEKKKLDCIKFPFRGEYLDDFLKKHLELLRLGLLFQSDFYQCRTLEENNFFCGSLPSLQIICFLPLLSQSLVCTPLSSSPTPSPACSWFTSLW